MKSDDSELTYRAAGVDIDAGDALVQRIKPAVNSTRRPEVLGGIGGFGGLFAMPEGFAQPVLVAGTDGVGTKLKLAIEQRRYHGLGIDLVAMCVNDIVVTGAQPLFFLDYFATARLDVEVAAQVIEGIADGCRQCHAALIGGETAEMPGLYQHADFDLAGFAVGAVEKKHLIDGSQVVPGDRLIALASSGPHANGFSLIRRIIERSGANLQQPCGDATLIDALLQPTAIYVRSLLRLIDAVHVKAIAHITGGGLSDNVPRVLPAAMAARIDTTSWQRPAVFDWLQQHGSVSEPEMRRTFNCGVGMVVCVERTALDTALTTLTEAGETAWLIGEVTDAGSDDWPLSFHP